MYSLCARARTTENHRQTCCKRELPLGHPSCRFALRLFLTGRPAVRRRWKSSTLRLRPTALRSWRLWRVRAAASGSSIPYRSTSC